MFKSEYIYSRFFIVLSFNRGLHLYGHPDRQKPIYSFPNTNLHINREKRGTKLYDAQIADKFVRQKQMGKVLKLKLGQKATAMLQVQRRQLLKADNSSTSSSKRK